MDSTFSESFIELTKMLFNTGYNLLTGIYYPGTLVTPLILILTGSVIIAGIRLIKHIIVEV